MKWLKKLFSTESEFIGDFIDSKEELLALVQSNPVVEAEFNQFTSKVGVIKSEGESVEIEIEKEAIKSATALSGYGISISPQAFIAVVT